jgi:adhesin transport system membrane fusion protein
VSAWWPQRRRGADAALRDSELAYVSAVHAARVVDPMRGASWAIYLMLAALASGLTWAALMKVDTVTRADARIVPDGREQVIASLEGGILRVLTVREGQQVDAGQELAQLDPTRFEAQQNEGRAKHIALQGMIARLEAEVGGHALQFPASVQPHAAVVQGETASYLARQRGLNEAVEINRRSMKLLERELAVAEGMSAKGLMSEVEVMRVRRQVNDLNQQTQERVNRFRQDANAELMRARSELAQLDEQIAGRDDVLRRTSLTSPVRGLVKNIRANTVGGVIAPGAPVMEIVPLGERVLVEARIKPADIGFVKVGQPVEVKLSAYESTVNGSLHGRVQTLSPDVLGDTERAATQDVSYYRALVVADRHSLHSAGQTLDVLPGMTGSAEINVGERTVLSYLLRPVLKAREAFRER